VVERLPRKRKALGWVPSSEKKNQKKKKRFTEALILRCTPQKLPQYALLGKARAELPQAVKEQTEVSRANACPLFPL